MADELYDAEGRRLYTQAPILGVTQPPLKRTATEAAPPPSKGDETYDADGKRIIDYNKLQPGPRLESDSTLQYLGRKLVNELPNITGGIGSLAGPIGGGAGGFVGSVIKNYPQYFSGDKEGAVTNVLKDTAEQSLMPVVAPYLSEAAMKLGRIISTRGSSLFTGQIPSDISEASHIMPEIPTSVAQETGSPTAKFLQRALAPGKQRELYDTQNALLDARENDLRQGITGLNKTSPGDIVGPQNLSRPELFGNEGQAVIKKNFEASQQNVSKLYNQVGKDAEAAKASFDVPTGKTIPAKIGATLDKDGNPVVLSPEQPEMKNIELKGPIAYPNTAVFMKQVMPELQTTIDRLPDGTPAKNKLVQLMSTMQDLSKPSNTQFMSDWNTIKQFRTDVYRSLNTTLPGDLSRGQGGMKTLADLLGKDIDQSVKTMWEPLAPGALSRMQNTVETSAQHYQTFNARVKSTVFGNQKSPADPSTIYETAKTNPEAAGEMIKALGVANQRSIRGSFFDDIIKDSRGDPKQALDLLDSPSYRKVFSASDYSDLSDFFKKVKQLTPDTSEAGKYSVALRGAGVVIGGVGGMLATGSPSISAGLGASVLIGGNQFASRVLLNPQIARQASRLANLDPMSPGASLLRRSILTAMRGTKVMLDYGDGDQKPATITASGGIKPD